MMKKLIPFTMLVILMLFGCGPVIVVKIRNESGGVVHIRYSIKKDYRYDDKEKDVVSDLLNGQDISLFFNKSYIKGINFNYVPISSFQDIFEYLDVYSPDGTKIMSVTDFVQDDILYRNFYNQYEYILVIHQRSLSAPREGGV